MDVLKSFFEYGDYETLLTNPSKSKAILMDLGLPSRDISLIIGVASSNPNLLRVRLFRVEDLSSLDTQGLVDEISRDSYFDRNAIESFILELKQAVVFHRHRVNKGNEKCVKTINSDERSIVNHSIQRLELIRCSNSEDHGSDSVVPAEHFSEYTKALSGNIGSQLYIADCFFEGKDGFSKSLVGAKRWYQKIVDNHPISSVDTDEARTQSLNVPDRFKVLYENALNDDRESQSWIGFSFFYGAFGFDKSYAEALKWFELAANQGDPYSMERLGTMYERGLGVNQSKNLAESWYKKACELNFAVACYELGILYSSDKTPTGKQKANKCYDRCLSLIEHNGSDYLVSTDVNAIVNSLLSTKLDNMGIKKPSKLQENTIQNNPIPEKYRSLYKDASNGDHTAQYKIGRLFYDGEEGFLKSYKTAYLWFMLSAEQNDANSLVWLGHMNQFGLGVQKSIPHAISYYEKSSVLNNSEAYYRLGLLYYSGDDVPQDYSKSLYYFEKAASMNNSIAMNYLGIQYINGYGVFQSYETAKEWFTKSSNLGNSVATYNLAVMYECGHGMSRKNVKKAVQLYRQSAEAGYSGAQYMMGLAYEEAKGGLPQSNVEALKWFELSAKQNNSYSLYKIGYYYEFGMGGLKKSLSKAKEYYQKASKLNHKDAKLRLDRLINRGI